MIMENGGFIPWDKWKPVLNRLSCPCCIGVRAMPDEEELEQLLLENLNLLVFEKQNETNETNENKNKQNETKGGGDK